jgi:hypothetical protein
MVLSIPVSSIVKLISMISPAGFDRRISVWLLNIASPAAPFLSDYLSANPDASATPGALSLILWTLFIVTTIKYVTFAMRIDNDGEGGILARVSRCREVARSPALQENSHGLVLGLRPRAEHPALRPARRL